MCETNFRLIVNNWEGSVPVFSFEFDCSEPCETCWIYMRLKMRGERWRISLTTNLLNFEKSVCVLLIKLMRTLFTWWHKNEQDSNDGNKDLNLAFALWGIENDLKRLS